MSQTPMCLYPEEFALTTLFWLLHSTALARKTKTTTTKSLSHVASCSFSSNLINPYHFWTALLFSLSIFSMHAELCASMTASSAAYNKLSLLSDKYYLMVLISAVLESMRLAILDSIWKSTTTHKSIANV